MAVAPRALIALAAATTLAGGCKKKKPPPPAPPPAPLPVAALAAIPADATVVVGLDVAHLAASDVVGRAVAEMFVRDPGLATRFERLARDCGVDVTHQIDHVYLALAPGGAGPARRALLVASGQLAEASLTRCLQAGVGSGGGDVTVIASGGRSLYKLVEGRHTVYFGFGQADTVVVGPDLPWVEAALANGPKVGTGVLAPYLALVDQGQALWFTAMMDPDFGTALVRTSKGAIDAPPAAVYAELDPRGGFHAHAAFVMQSNVDASALVTFARGELALGSLAAQAWNLGPVVAKIEVAPQGAEVHFRVALTDAEFKDVLTAVDSGGGGGQIAPPAADGGLGTAPDARDDAGP
ncbi:MAG: hypothetical protein IPL61_40750 [Myxococcales bacterium]|nr:hypothetical protein [Myxococcales bacterium]